jgi:hypothetical protein
MAISLGSARKSLVRNYRSTCPMVHEITGS